MSRISVFVLMLVVSIAALVHKPVIDQSRLSNATLIAQQENLDDRRFVLTASTQIITKMAADQGKEEAEVNALTRSQEEAEKQLDEVRKQKQKAEATAIEKRNKVEEAEFAVTAIIRGTHEGNGDLRAARKEVNEAISERAAALRAVEILATYEAAAVQQVTEGRATRETREAALKTHAALRAERKKQLQGLNDAWRRSPSEENSTALFDGITAISCEQEVFVSPAWKTTPNMGANLFYQSLGERKRGKAPNQINNPTQTQQPICLGRYYVWAQREGRVTSDQSKVFDIYQGISEVVVVEDR